MLDAALVKRIRRQVLAHYRRAGRDLPFRATRDPYGIWVCEIMAQQTRLAVVVPFWRRWLARFPTIEALARASQGDVLAAWTGLGYYARARHLHEAARRVVAAHGGRLPDDLEALRALPGIGRYTAGAIASIAFGRRAAVLDGNVARLYARLFGLEAEGDRVATAARARLWALAEALVPPRRAGDFNQGLMDLGATVCVPRNPRCDACPLTGPCATRRRAPAAAPPARPPRRARRRPPVIEIDLAWVARGGRWLLVRRVPDGLFGGLWELPELAAARRAWGSALEVVEHRPLASLVHELSHRTIHYRVYPARLAADARARGAAVPDATGYDAARFVAPAQLAFLGVSSATLKLAGALRLPRPPRGGS